MDNLKSIKNDVVAIMGASAHGHGIEHVLRVYDMAFKFCKGCAVDLEIVALTALLHDADDYKIFGDTGNKLPNANYIMQKNNIREDIRCSVSDNINNMGYSKRLAGILPETTEGKLVSDADMCDAIGSTGIIRVMEYNIFKKTPFWNRNNFPIINPMTEQYKATNCPMVDHFFEKLFKIKDLMLTEPGKCEASQRHNMMVGFLEQFFKENNAPEWIDFMNNFFAKQRN